MSSQMTNARYYARPWGKRFGVFDLAETRGDPLSKHDDEIDAIAEAARRSAQHEKKMGRAG